MDADNKAAIGTIIGYAKGTWKDSKTRMRNDADNGIRYGMSTATQLALQDAKSEINFGVPVEMSAKICWNRW